MKVAYFWSNWSATLPVGPLRCFSIMRSIGIGVSLLSPSYILSVLRWRNMTTSASCSIEPESRRSERRGFPSRFSTSRESWERARTGMESSRATCLSVRDTSVMCCTIDSLFRLSCGVMSCR